LFLVIIFYFFENANRGKYFFLYKSDFLDEEIGGKLGICEFIKTQVFKDSNIGLVFDEGAFCTNDLFLLG
jgi:hypothetical protein